mgnify:CR=1 FL=1
MAGAGTTRLAALLAALALAAGGSKAAEPANDYPTVVRADYVFGCMQVNGQTREALEKCSCSIDVIASLLPFDLVAFSPRRQQVLDRDDQWGVSDDSAFAVDLLGELGEGLHAVLGSGLG